MSDSKTKLLAIVANTRGAEEAAVYDEISYVGFPFSVSETFQQRNTNSSIAESLKRVEEIQNICIKKGKQLVIYISMAFGNPYGDPYAEEIVFKWVNTMVVIGCKDHFAGRYCWTGNAEQVFSMTDYLVKKLPEQQIGVHLHSRPANRKAKIDAALKAGCLQFRWALERNRWMPNGK